MKHLKYFPLICLATVALAGCAKPEASSSTAASTEESSSTTLSSESPSSSSVSSVPSQEKTDVTPFDVRDIYETRILETLPSEGNVNLLLIPIEMSDYPFRSNYKDVLDTAFNADGPAETGYWESVSSFYEKASFGKVKLHYEIADKYVLGKSAKAAAQEYGEAWPMGKEALEDYKEKNGADSTKKFDSDSSGFIDGCVFIYSCPDYAMARYDFDASIYWAYVTYAYYYETSVLGPSSYGPNVDSPVANCFCFGSIDFITLFAYPVTMDTHTYIHETGHMFGLDDYYAGDNSRFNPTGGCTMMDQTILDLDAYSKLSLGWIDPYVVSDDCVLKLNPSATTGDCILVPNPKWNGTAFDEYILLELYSPVGLNYQDSHERYGPRLIGYSKPGIQLYHIDSRLMKAKNTVSSYKTGWTYMKNPTKEEIESLKDTYVYIGATNNSKDFHPAQDKYSLIHLIEAGKANTFAMGRYGTDETLFQQGDVFNMNEFGPIFFPNGVNLNNSTTFEYQITIESVASDEASIRFELIA